MELSSDVITINKIESGLAVFNSEEGRNTAYDTNMIVVPPAFSIVIPFYERYKVKWIRETVNIAVHVSCSHGMSYHIAPDKLFPPLEF